MFSVPSRLWRRSALVPTASVLAALLVVAACSPDQTALTGLASSARADAISDGANGGNPHFFFLNPMVPKPTTTGLFDGSLEPLVEICIVDPMQGCGEPIAIFNTMVGSGSETVRVSVVDEHYIVNWHSGDFDLDPAATYRIRVSVGFQELGFADVDVVSNGRELMNVTTGEYVGLVDGRTLPIKFRIEEGALASAVPMVAGGNHACALDASGAAYCWGLNNVGQLGIGTIGGNQLTPVAVTGGHTFQSITAGIRMTCGLTTAGDAYCWGSNQWGQIGTGAAGGILPTPTRVSGGPWQSIAPSSQHTCALDASGEAWCWGLNNFGQLGRGTYTLGEPTPAPVTGGRTFQSISTLANANCGVTTAGDGYCWGYNQWGNLGTGTFINSINVPTLVTGGHTFQSIDAGISLSCGVTTAGDAYCWGGNRGDISPGLVPGTIGLNVANPVAVYGEYTFQSVRAGLDHACGVTTDGEGLCWGANLNGEVGNGSTGLAQTPVPVLGGFTWSVIDTGQRFSCGSTTTGEAYCWGLNSFGQLGDGTGANSSTPTIPLDLTP